MGGPVGPGCPVAGRADWRSPGVYLRRGGVSRRGAGGGKFRGGVGPDPGGMRGCVTRGRAASPASPEAGGGDRGSEAEGARPGVCTWQVTPISQGPGLKSPPGPRPPRPCTLWMAPR